MRSLLCLSGAQSLPALEVFTLPAPQLTYAAAGALQVEWAMLKVLERVFLQASVRARYHLLPWARAQFQLVVALVRNRAYVYARQSERERVSSMQKLRGVRGDVGRGTSGLALLQSLDMVPDEVATTVANADELIAGCIDYATGAGELDEQLNMKSMPSSNLGAS